MWTKEHRARQASFERRRYPTDLTDQEWQVIWPLPPASTGGRRPGVDLRAVLNAIRHLARAGYGWRMLPVHCGPWQTIYRWFRRFVRRFLFATLHNIALMLDRERVGREASPSAGVLGSQTIKSPHARGGGGFDATGAEQIVKAIRERWPWLKHLFADGAYDRGKLMRAAAHHDFVIEVVRKLAGQQGFQDLPRRWVVERTFGWMTRWRRLVRDYERRCDVSETMIHISMGALLIRRIAHP
jgi:transposase